MASELVQIYYRDEQKNNCYPFARLYNNQGLTIFFENSVIAELVAATEHEKIGVCSWKLRNKLKANVRRPRQLTKEVIETDYDILSFTGNTKDHEMLYAANRWHPGFRDVLLKLGQVVGFPVPREVKQPIYQNAFMAKADIYQDYVKNYLSKAMEATVNDESLYKMMTVNSDYSQLLKEDAAGPDELQEKIGFPYYPLAPFVLERLFSIYVHNNRLNVTWL